MKQTKRTLSLLLSLCLVLGLIPGTAFAAGGNLPFTDVDTTDWCYDAVQYVYEKGMMNGTSTTTFSPDGTTTRGMIVTILHRMEGTPAATGTTFTDVPIGQWYSDAVSWASANGIVGGYGNGLFGPSNPITREQMAAILNRYSMYKGYDTGTVSSITGFSDASKVSSYAVNPMGWAIGNGLISGVGNNTLAPKGNATRAQVATILKRFCENIADKANTAPETPADKTYTVTFDLNYGSDTRYDAKTVKEGETVSKPSNPSRSGYSFGGWYAEKSGGRQFDFKTGITSDLTLYAHWSSNSSSSGGGGSSYVPPVTTYYTVTFYMNDGTDTVHTTASVAYGGKVSAPAAPTRSGYTFDGWYTLSSGGTLFDFSSSIHANTALHAYWTPSDENDPTSPSGTLSVSITTPDVTVTDIHQSLNGTFTATDSAPISAISWTASNTEFDGEYDQGEAVIDASSGTWNIMDIRLRPGANEIKITAEDQTDNTAQATVVITYDSGSLATYSESEITYFVDEQGNPQDSGYVNDVILVILDGSSEVTDIQREEALVEVCATVNGEVIGQLNGILMYQIKVAASDHNTLNELCELAKSASQLVLSATCDLVQPANFPEVEPITEEDLSEGENLARAMNIPNDPWKDVFQGFWGQNWDESNPSGLNWWVEAVQAPSAWDHNDYFNTIQIGIVDAGIDKSHEDLSAITSLRDNIADDHGTHVAGIIGATANNRTGITGMVWNKKLYSYDAYQGESTTSKISEGITKLVESGCKVINNSNGTKIDSSYIADNGSYASGIINNLVSGVTDNFIIVCAAGNDGIDSRRNGTYCSIESGSALDHVIVVAAADKPSWGNYKLTDFSNYGDYITVAAPGESVFSTIITGGIDGSYGNMSGTSMATPIVTGVVSLVWSVNDKFTAREVKDIVTSTATTNVSGYSNIWGRNDNRTYHMVNALKAVEKAIALTTADGRVTGRFVDATTGSAMPQVNWRVHSGGNMGPDVCLGTTGSGGDFSFSVPAGYYVIEAYGDFITSYTPVTVRPNGTVSLGNIPISKQIDSDTYRVVLEWGEYPSDLDSHLVASKQNGSSIHVYFSSKLANEANLDVDDTSSYGPETVTIDKFAELNGFMYSVHNFTARSASSIADPGAYSSRDSLAHSGATVKLYKGGSLLKTYRVPTNQAGTVWNVFSINASGRITDLNTFEYISEPENVGRGYVPRSVSENGIDALDSDREGWQKVCDDMTDSSQQDDSPESGLLDPIKIQITDTTSGSGVSDVTYALRIGENNRDGEALDSGILNGDTYTASLPVGTYTLEVSKDGYEPVYANIIVDPDADLTIAIELTPEGSPDAEDTDSTDGSEVSEDADISVEDATQEDVSIQSEESDLDFTLEDVA